MNSEPEHPRSLREIELAMEVEEREWMRQRLQQEADLYAGVFPPQRVTRCASFEAQDADADRSPVQSSTYGGNLPGSKARGAREGDRSRDSFVQSE